MRSKYIVGIIVGVLAVGGGAFWYGRQYEQGRSLSASVARSAEVIGAGPRGARGNGTRGQGGGAGFITGDIIARDVTGITVKLRVPQNVSGTPSASSGSRIIFFSDTTEVGKTVIANVDELTAGTAVTVTGTPNPDGSLTAESIQIRDTRGATPR